jgi:hypothetical protein
MVAARCVMLDGVKLAGVAFVMLDKIKPYRAAASLPLARDVPRIMGGCFENCTDTCASQADANQTGKSGYLFATEICLTRPACPDR